jgi:hypothetical protein
LAPTLAELLHLVVERRRLVVDEDHAAPRPAIRADRHHHPVAVAGVEIVLEQIDRFHNVHVAINES